MSFFVFFSFVVTQYIAARSTLPPNPSSVSLMTKFLFFSTNDTVGGDAMLRVCDVSGKRINYRK